VKIILEKILNIEVIEILGVFEDNQEKYIDFITEKETNYFIDYISKADATEPDCLNSIPKFELLHLIKEYLLKNDYHIDYDASRDVKWLNIYYDNSSVWFNKIIDISEFDIFVKAFNEIFKQN
jgi:hypothetical protein